MGHHCSYNTRIIVEDNLVKFITTAYYGDKSADVFIIDENERCKCRYLTYNRLAGYLVSFPGEKTPYSYYYGTSIQKEESFSDCREWVGFETTITLKEIKDAQAKIEKIHPEYHYLLNKINCERIEVRKFIKICNLYKSHPEIEILVQLNLIDICTNKAFWGYKEPTRKKYLEYLKHYLDDIQRIKKKYLWGDINVKKLGTFMKDFPYIPNVPLLPRYEMKRYNMTEKEYRYCKNKEIELSDYKNYIYEVKNVGHKLDDYWCFPNNFQKQFCKVNQEAAAIAKVKEMEKQLLLEDGITKFKELSDKTKKSIGNYTFYIACSYKDISEQAKTLNQCLIRNNYIDKMINLKSILIFILKKDTNERVATAEIDWDKELLQLYGYEYQGDEDPNHIKSQATQEVKDTLAKYIKNLKLEKPQIKKYANDGTVFYKGVTEDMQSIYGGSNIISYQIGQVYDTKISDEDFNENCKSSNKAIHFCKDIHDVIKYVPEAKKIITLKVLGKVCNVNTEYFSNRIKVLDIVSV